MDLQTPASFSYLAILERLIGLLNKTKARERFCRFFQYFAKFFTAYMKGKGGSQDSDEGWETIISLIGSACAQTRKILRFGMEFPCLVRINALLERYFQLLQNKKDGSKLYLL